MLKFLKWVFVAGFTLALLGIAFVWLVLSAPFFSDLRRSTTEKVLSEQIKQQLYVREDVKVVVGPISRIYVAGVEIPSENIPDTNLAELNLLELDLDLVALLNGKIDLDNLTVDGLQVNVLTEPDGTNSWTPSRKPDAPKVSDGSPVEQPVDRAGQDEEAGGILAFLRHRTAAFTSIGLTVDDQMTGFEFAFDLEHLNLEQLDDGNRLGVEGLGTVNGQTFEIEGDYPTGAPFSTRAAFGDMKLSFDGIPIPVDQGGGFSGELVLDTGKIGDLLDVLKLERVFEGTGLLSAGLKSQGSTLQVSDLETVVNLETGQQLKLSGSVENLLQADGFDITFDGRFHPEGQPPTPAEDLKGLKLTGIHAHVVSGDKELEFEQLKMTTNAFDQGLNNIGPVSIERIRRTQEGHLALEGVSLQAGPVGAPYVQAKGNIRNLLQLKELDLEGTLAAPASLVLKNLSEDVAKAFGGVKAEFSVDDSQGFLSLNRLNATTVDTDVWALAAHAELGNVTKLNALDVDLALEIMDTASFLRALKLEEIDAGPMEISLSANRLDKELTAGLGLAAGSSRVDTSLAISLTEERPKVEGDVFSERLDTADLKNAIATVVELAKMGEGSRDDPDVQPLVQSEEQTETDVQPLVLPEKKKKPTDLVDLEELLLETDLNVAIEIKEIVGQQGVSSLSSELSAKDGKANLGPLEVTLGGGYFSVQAEMDLVETPELVSVSGATSGWDFGEILDSIGLGIDAHGKLRGNFNVTGNIKSAKTFINSMSGNASISMADGDIATSLLELAGLGIFPWLFSEELGQGYTNIVCVVAPVRIDAGKVSFDSVVAETESVQLVARGLVDWRNDSIAIRAEPRRVGKPLSRSAWPFDVTGKLSEPKFKLDVGGSRSKRSDEADEMPADRKPCVPDILQLE